MESTAVLARKRAVNLTLNQELVVQAKTYTHNLSATVEELLSGYVVGQQQARANREQAAQACTTQWNALHQRIGSFADEHSTL